MKTFEEWCQDREIVLNELSPKFLAMAYKIWGEDCFVEGQRYEAENAALRERLERTVELREPRITVDHWGGLCEVVYEKVQVVSEGYETRSEAETRVAQLKGEKE